MVTYPDWLSRVDMYQMEKSRFQRDVHVLILGTLHASVQYLDADAKKELQQVEAKMKEAASDEYHEHLVDEHVDVMSQNADQETFLYNMALVALASRLTHALRKMATTAESFSPRKKRYGNKSKSEFDRLWMEYEERFGIDFVANASRIDFVETMREVRNQIVHDGSEANTLKPLDEVESGPTGEETLFDILDTKFSEKHPEYTFGTGMGAEVRVSQELLDKNVEASLDLVDWLSHELRRRELASIGNSDRPQ